MMGKNSIKVSISHIDKVNNMAESFNLLPDEVQRASVRAVNRALTSVRALGTRIARETYTAPVEQMKKDIKIKKATNGYAAGTIDFQSGRGVLLHHFLPSPKKQPSYKGVNPRDRKPVGGVSTKIKKQGSRKVKLGPEGQKPFWITTRKGIRALFYRAGKGVKNIQPLFGPSPVQALQRFEARKRMYNQADETFSRRLDHEMRVIMKKIVTKIGRG